MQSFKAQMDAGKAAVLADISQVLRLSLIEAGERLVDRSPIDTGLFASNWRYGLVTPDAFTTKTPGQRIVHNLEEIPANLVGLTHFITNSIPYGPALEDGHSGQAPNGFVGITSAEWPSVVASNAGRVRNRTAASAYQGGAL